jgi:initiation factor 1A
MVKNTTGGSGAKSVARKDVGKGGGRGLTLPSCNLEVIACVTKALGNGMLEVHTNDNKRLIAHIRNKFRGKQKRNNMINLNSLVLVGLRDWENPIKNCDIMSIYDSNDVEQLKNIPNIKIDHILHLSLGAIAKNSVTITTEVSFTEDAEQEYNGMPASETLKFNINDTEEIDVNDI